MKFIPERKYTQFQKFLSYFLRITVLAGYVLSLVFQEWLLAFQCVLIFLSFNLPALIERQLRVSLPTEFELTITVFLYASFFLGEVRDYYERFWWWDSALHTLSGIILGFIGFVILYSLYDQKKLQMSPSLLAMFTFTFAMALGGLWEIFEFTMDQLFGLNMQKSGLIDTMWDLIVDAIGAFSVSLIGYFYIRFKKSPISLFDQLLQRFIKENTPVN